MEEKYLRYYTVIQSSLELTLEHLHKAEIQRDTYIRRGMDAKAISRYDRQIERNRHIYATDTARLRAVDTWIDSINDEMIKDAITLKYIKNMSWSQVATALHYEGNVQTLSHYVQAYIRKHTTMQ